MLICSGFLYNFSFLTAEVLILGDSIPKYVTGDRFKGFHNKCVPGATIAKLTDAVVFGGQPGSRYDAVVLHVGCNNVVPGSTALGVASQYKFLIEAVYPTTITYLSAIIPKPCVPSASFLIQLINELSCIIAARMGCIFLANYKRFCAGQSVNSALFSRSDLLHINGAGISQMGSFLREQTDPRRAGALREQTFLRAQKLTAKLREDIPPYSSYKCLAFVSALESWGSC